MVMVIVMVVKTKQGLVENCLATNLSPLLLIISLCRLDHRFDKFAHTNIFRNINIIHKNQHLSNHMIH